MSIKEGFSIIIPTYHEAKNIPNLVKRFVNLSFSNQPFELILVDDDSQDGTTELVDQLRTHYPWITLHVRPKALGASWSESILEGIAIANYPILIFMDADLSHPPESIPEMLSILHSSQAEMVIGSRYMQGGHIDKKWPFYRIIISRLATLVVKPLLPGGIKDPLSGFIAIKKNLHERNGHLWKPLGTKLALEIIVKSKVKTIKEIPIYFQERQFGKSKLLGMRMAKLYAKQVMKLWQHQFFG